MATIKSCCMSCCGLLKHNPCCCLSLKTGGEIVAAIEFGICCLTTFGAIFSLLSPGTWSSMTFASAIFTLIWVLGGLLLTGMLFMAIKKENTYIISIWLVWGILQIVVTTISGFIEFHLILYALTIVLIHIYSVWVIWLLRYELEQSKKECNRDLTSAETVASA